MPIRLPLALAPLLALAACSGTRTVDSRTTATAPPPVAPDAVTTDFESAPAGLPPRGFSTAVAGGGASGEWIVEAYPEGTVLAQRSLDEARERSPLCVLDGLVARDFSLTVRFYPVSGQVERAAGLVARLQSPDDHLVVRASALEDDVRLEAVVAGERRTLAAADVEVRMGVWHELRLDARGPRFAVFLDGTQLFTAEDATLIEPGQVGVATIADSVVRFDDFRCEPLRTDSPLR